VNLLTSAPNICAAFIQYCATSCFLHLLDDGNMEPKGEEKLQSCLFSKLCLILPSFENTAGSTPKACSSKI
jgi:hypothetical protein